MKSLSSELRRHLERTIADARDMAENGARAALEALAVHHHEPYEHMSAEQRALRRRLRAHARQLGDRRDARSGSQAIEHLVSECAYEHWHGMLFARFLAENHLLIEPEHGIAVTLEECEELGKGDGVDKWVLAARFAHRMLPQVFRLDLPVFEVRFAREHQLKLEGLVEGLPSDVFAATDSLGWVYQFWQSRKKAEVNRSETKIGADELPAVTQLFTEPYIVSFLLDNSLGAWWAARRLSDSDLREASAEAELRRKVAIPDVPLDYLRFVQREDTAEQPGWCLAAGAFDSWPEHLGELRVLDPCCGSGHFLVAAFSMLAPMRVMREGLTARDAVDAVLRDNLHGLELDPRCVELAAFALALAAWTYPGAEGYRPLPELNVACSGLSVGTAREQWTELAAGRHNLRIALDWMYEAFRDAPVLGSLLNPAATDAAKLVDRRELSTVLAQALAREQSDERRETAIAAHGLAKAAELLAGRYHLVITNVPYLVRGKQDETLRAFCQRRYAAAKNDLATVFLERCLELCEEDGTASLVLPQNWLFLVSYRKLREKLLKTETWHLLARLGPGAFETVSGEVVKAILLTLSRGNSAGYPGGLFGEAAVASAMYGLDVSEFRTAGEKAIQLREAEPKGVEQARQLENPDARVALVDCDDDQLLGTVANGFQGIASADYPRFGRGFWEISNVDGKIWIFQQSTVNETVLFGGKEHVLYWEDGDGVLSNSTSARIQGLEAWDNWGVATSQMRAVPVTLHTPTSFDNNTAALIPKNQRYLAAIWCFCSSPEYHDAVRRIDQKLNVTNATLVKVPFNVDRWTEIAREKYPNGLPCPYSDDPTQWIFHGHPCGSVVWDETGKQTAYGPLRTDPTVLQVVVARLLGYRWPAEQDAGMELADEQREWVQRCKTLLAGADKDGIVCIPPVRGESPAGERVLQLLAAAFGDAWSDSVLTRLLAKAGSPSLDDYLRNRFFEEHCKLFRHRPFVWHIWDGRRRDGFHALVNYHKLAEGDGKGRRCLEVLTYSYLGDWITRQQDGVKHGEDGAEDRLAAALELQKRLVAILASEPPCDIFIRWKPIEAQPIGWEPDINDGVRLNIRPFMADDIPGGKKGAGILRAKPNIHWRKDRGKEPFREQEQFPWFWRDDEFTGLRVNDVHLIVAEKSKRRQEGIIRETQVSAGFQANISSSLQV